VLLLELRRRQEGDKTPDDTGGRRLRWPTGPWDDEPNRVEWRHQVTGWPLLMVRNTSGAWCGYAAVPPGHPLHGLAFGDADLRAHGGVNFAGPCRGEVCHVAEPGEPDNVWWFGFDCMHAWDFAPWLITNALHPEVVLPWQQYRDQRYVRAEVESLGEQLAARMRM